MAERLAGKVAIVTGSGSGIGRGCALLFALRVGVATGMAINIAAYQLADRLFNLIVPADDVIAHL